jgi:hypothetical protein
MVNREGQLALGNLEEQNNEPSLLGRIGQAASGAMAGMNTSNNMDWASMLKQLQNGGGGGGANLIGPPAPQAVR